MLLFLCLLLDPPAAYAQPPAAYTSPVRDYAAACAAVRSGDVVCLAVGVKAQPGDYTHTGALAFNDGREVKAGRYLCRKEGKDWMRLDPVSEPQPILPRLFNPPVVPVIGGS